MVSLQGFDASKVDPKTSRKPLPVGDYTVLITSAERVPTKSGNGDLMKVEMQVCDGKHKGRKVFVNLNLWNTSEQARKIAQSELSSICRAVGILTPHDSNELKSKPFRVSLGIEERQGYGPQNKVTEYMPLKEKKAGSEQETETEATSSDNDAPWD